MTWLWVVKATLPTDCGNLANISAVTVLDCCCEKAGVATASTAMRAGRLMRTSFVLLRVSTFDDSIFFHHGRRSVGDLGPGKLRNAKRLRINGRTDCVPRSSRRNKVCLSCVTQIACWSYIAQVRTALGLGITE